MAIWADDGLICRPTDALWKTFDFFPMTSKPYVNEPVGPSARYWPFARESFDSGGFMSRPAEKRDFSCLLKNDA